MRAAVALIALAFISMAGPVPSGTSQVAVSRGAAADSVIVRVTSEDGTAPATFEARYLLVGGALPPGAPPGGVVTSRQTPYTLALPATSFQGVFHQVGSARIHVELLVRRGGQTMASATAVAPISLLVADEKGTAAAMGF